MGRRKKPRMRPRPIPHTIRPFKQVSPNDECRVPPVEKHIVNQSLIPQYMHQSPGLRGQASSYDREQHKRCTYCGAGAEKKAMEERLADVGDEHLGADGYESLADVDLAVLDFADMHLGAVGLDDEDLGAVAAAAPPLDRTVIEQYAYNGGTGDRPYYMPDNAVARAPERQVTQV